MAGPTRSGVVSRLRRSRRRQLGSAGVSGVVGAGTSGVPGVGTGSAGVSGVVGAGTSGVPGVDTGGGVTVLPPPCGGVRAQGVSLHQLPGPIRPKGASWLM